MTDRRPRRRSSNNPDFSTPVQMTHGLARAPSAPPSLRFSSADFPKPPLSSSEWLLRSQSHPRQALTANKWTGTRMPVRSPFFSCSAAILIQVVSSTVPINHRSDVAPALWNTALTHAPTPRSPLLNGADISEDSEPKEETSEDRDAVLVSCKG